MTTPIEVWLRAADALLGSAEPPDDQVDELIHEGLDVELPAEPVQVDPVQLERVLAVLRADPRQWQVRCRTWRDGVSS